jgi:hypothetical protein
MNSNVHNTNLVRVPHCLRVRKSSGPEDCENMVSTILVTRGFENVLPQLCPKCQRQIVHGRKSDADKPGSAQV